MNKEVQYLSTIEALKQILKENYCTLYGAGEVSSTLIKYATREKIIIGQIVVTEEKGNPSEVLSIPVMRASEESLSGATVVVCTIEKYFEEIEKELIKYETKDVWYLSDKVFKEIKEKMYLSEKKEKDLITKDQDKYMKFITKPCLEYMVLNILDHCNLRCKGCDHFACIADKYEVPYKTIHEDIKRMAEIFHNDYIMKIAVMGGEPLLHPELLKILKDVRESFPHAMIRLTTNGILLLKQKEDFWETCKENDIVIVQTRYPIALDFEGIREKAEMEGVKHIYFEGTGDKEVRKSFKKIIDLEGNNDPVESFANCHISNYGNFLMEGKMYSCPFSCQSYRIFNKKFKKELRLTEKDYLDIYQVDDMQTFFEFAARPKFYCRYCTGISPLFDWTRSKQEIVEWVEGKI